MSLIHTTRHAATRNLALRSSYAEISRFVTLRYGEVTQNRQIPCLRKEVRCFSASRSFCDDVESGAKVQKMLDDFKATIRPSSWDTLSPITRNQKVLECEIGTEIELLGYLGPRRDINKKLAFTDFLSMNQTWSVQLVSSSNKPGEEADAHERMRSLREWTPVVVRGKVLDRKPGNSDESDTHTDFKPINDRELSVQHVQPLNEIPTDIIIKSDTVFGPDRRHLQLRTDRRLRKNIVQRSRLMSLFRSRLVELGWLEIETPILFKSTPEGAREFLVPTRQQGLAYALPQSPQQYKQILMASGFTRYFQFARCFRDENLRADRQPEFTQLDMEMSFASEEDVMRETESLLRRIWQRFLKSKTPDVFPRMTYQEAMASYGSDKPDLRYRAKIYPITQYLPTDLISKITSLESPVIEAFKIPISSNPETTRKFITDFLDSPLGKPYLENPDGQPGVFVSDLAQPMQGLAALGHQYVMEGPQRLSAGHGDLLILQARPNVPFSGGSRLVGNLRLALYKAAVAQGLLKAPENEYQFVWITDFPLFTPSNDSDPGQGGTAGFSSTHHPFTAPKTAQDVDLLLTAPGDAIAAHYDIVCNGIELGGGSRRIHQAALQEFIFKDILKMAPERVEDFRHLLDVLRSGCPPHAGIALGWDRVVALICGRESVRDVIAFPKTGSGEDPLVGSPNRVTEKQWDTYHLRVKE